MRRAALAGGRGHVACGLTLTSAVFRRRCDQEEVDRALRLPPCRSPPRPGFAPCTWSSSGGVSASLARHKRRRPFLDIRGKVLYGGEQGLLSVAFPPDFRLNRLALRLLHEQPWRQRDRRGACPPAGCAARRKTLRHACSSSPIPASRTTTAASSSSAPTAALCRHRRRRERGDPDDNAQDHGSLLGKILRIDPAAQRPEPYRSRRTTPSSASRGATRSSRSACATRIASRSTAPPPAPGSRSATSARSASRRSTTRPSAAPTAPTSAGTTSRGSPRSRAPIRRARKHDEADPGLHATTAAAAR